MTPTATMTSRERLMTALKGGVPDRLPATTHHLMPYFLDKYLDGMGKQEFFEAFGLDAIHWTVPHRHDAEAGEYPDPEQGEIGFLESRRVATDDWRIFSEELPGNHAEKRVRFRIETPKGTLTTVLGANASTA